MVFDGNLAIKSSSRYLRFVLGKLKTQRLKVKPSHQMVLSIFTTCNYYPSLLRRKRERTDPYYCRQCRIVLLSRRRFESHWRTRSDSFLPNTRSIHLLSKVCARHSELASVLAYKETSRELKSGYVETDRFRAKEIGTDYRRLLFLKAITEF